MDFLSKLEQLSAVRPDWWQNTWVVGWLDTDPRIIELLMKFGWAREGTLSHHFTPRGDRILSELEYFIEELFNE